MASGRSINVPTGYTLIFWGNYFDESVAIIFATTLREAGNCVKMVGLNGPYATGQNGITVQCDMSVTDILEIVDQVRCVILPDRQCSYGYITTDPRLSKFFTDVAKAGVTFVINASCDILRTFLPATIYQELVLTYPGKDALLEFASALSHRLAGRLSAPLPPASVPFPIASPMFGS